MAVHVARPPLEPIRSPYRVRFLGDDQLDQLQAATLRILEEVGVRFPSAMALEILADHGAKVDMASQVVRFPPDLVRRALATAPRYFTMGARVPEYDLHLADGVDLVHDRRLRHRDDRLRHARAAPVAQERRRPRWPGSPTTCRRSGSTGRW